MRRAIYSLLSCTIFHALSSSAQSSENTGNLYTVPADSEDGQFDFPRTYPLTFREGSTINITWSTTYEAVNLYYYQRGNVANSIQLATNQAVPWYQWQVFAEETDLTEPFVFRIVKSQGTDEEVKGGGFWSTSYYIERSEEDAASSSVTPTSTPAPSSTSAPTATPTSTPTGSPITSSAEQTPSSSPKGSDRTTQTPAPEPSSGVSTGAIIGLAVGLSLAVIIIAAGAFLLFRRRKGNKANRSSVHPSELPTTTEAYGHWAPKDAAYTERPHEVYVQPSEMSETGAFYELPAGKNSPRVQ